MFSFLGLHKWKWKKVKSLSRVWLFATPWTIAYQAPPSMGFSRQECWSGLPFPSPGDLPNPGIESGSPTLQADTLPSAPPDGHCRRVPKLFQFSDACRFPPISLPKPWEVRFRFRMTFLSFFLSCIILGSLCFDQIWTQFWWRILWYCDGVYQNVNTRTTTRL